MSRDLHAEKNCPESLVVKAVPLWNSKVPGAVPQDWVSIAVKAEARCLATEHNDDAEVPGVGEPALLASDLDQSLAEGHKSRENDAEDLGGSKGGKDDTGDNEEVAEGAAVGEPAMLLGSTLAQTFSEGHKDLADAEEGSDDGGECRRIVGDGQKVPGEVGGDEDAPAPATDNVGPNIL